MSTVQDLAQAANQLVEQGHVMADNIGGIHTAVDRLVNDWEALKANTHLSDADQAQMDAAVQEVTDATAELARQAANVAAETQSVDEADPGAPNPLPTPMRGEGDARLEHRQRLERQSH